MSAIDTGAPTVSLEMMGLIVAVVGTLVAIPSLWEFLGNKRLDYRLEKNIHSIQNGASSTISFPINLRRKVRYSEYKKILRLFSDYLEKKEALHVAAYVGVNVSGMWAAAELSNSGAYHPLLHVEIELDRRQVPIAKSAIAHFDLERYRGQQVLVVDNSIRTGETLKKVVDLLESHGISTATCVIYRKRNADGSMSEPDYVVMQPRRGRAFDHWLR